VKAASRFEPRDCSALRAFAERTPGMRLAVLAYNGSEAVRLDKRLWAIPIGLLLS
jgi:hypothetical protein